MQYKDKQILVIGAGRSGIGVAEVLSDAGAKVVLNDNKSVVLDTPLAQRFQEKGIALITGHQEEELLVHKDLVVVSPGVPTSIPLLVAARKEGIPVIGEVEVAFSLCKAPMLAVTGTNGKTTTTTLLAEVMKAAGYTVGVGGNIGASLSEVAVHTPADGIVVAEISSYQLETVKDFAPKGSIVLNVTPDHLQRHKTMAAYQAAKEKIFAKQGPEDFTILNIDDEAVASMAERTKGTVLAISQKEVVSDGAYYDGYAIFAARHGMGRFVIRREDIHLPGAHNIENILAVTALAYAMGVDAKVIGETVASFMGVEHRIERVRKLRGVTYYNDSKATNTDSAEKALLSFSEPIILIAGGHDKMTDLHSFMTLVKEKVKDLILIGEAQDRFYEAAKAAGVSSLFRANSMAEAVNLAYDLGLYGDVVLLSPACSSFDWYHCFEERGDDFKKEVMALVDEQEADK